MNMRRVEELENILYDMVHEEPDNTIEQREQLALYLVNLEERLQRLEKNLEEYNTLSSLF